MKLALLVLFTGTTLAAPFWVLDENLPRAEIKEVGCSGNRFQNGKSHVYEYEGVTYNTIEGSTDKRTGIKLTATATITPMTECKFMMQLNSVKLMSKSMDQDTFTTNVESDKLKAELEKFMTGFSMKGNEIVTLHVNENEPTHVLNIKRSILSNLQLDESTKKETDINGKCDVELVTVDGKIVKSKKLSECTERAQNEIGFQSTSIKSATTLKPLDSTSRCEFTMNGDVIKSVVCDEKHIFKPFSAGYKTPSGAMTTVKQTLEFKEFTKAIVSAVVSDFSVETNLLFDHTTEEVTATSTINDQVEKVMLRLVDPALKSDLSAKENSAQEFKNLVTLFRKMDEKRMETTWTKYFDCVQSGICNDANIRELYRQYLLDGIAHCGTSSCISMVRNVIVNGQITGERMNMFLRSIPFVTKTTMKMIGDVLEICEKNPSRQAYLTLGTLLLRHCKQNPEDCSENLRNPVSMAEEHLVRMLGQECEGQDKPERVEELLRVLKAIGNAQRPVRVQEKLMNCAVKSIHANVTTSIFDALRGFSCDSIKQGELLRVFEDINNEDETRIHAFITIMKCPTVEILEKVTNMLEKELSNQVASYMWSYLTNLMESSDPRHKLAKDILTKMTATKPLREVNLPVYKFSKAFEKSLHSEFLKSGVTAEGHIIFNKDRYLPKMGMLNMKANLMGNSLDMLETKIGLDGIEPILETLVGPNGMLPKDLSIDLGSYGKFNSEFLKKMLEKRNNKRKLFNDNLTKMHLKGGKKFVDPNAHLSIKIMGQEVTVLSYDDILWMIDQIDNMNAVQLLTNIAKGGHKTFSKSLMFLEMAHTVPTGMGLPLKLKLTGSAVGTVELNGKFDIRNLFWGTPAVNVKGHIKPSTVVELSGQMGVEGPYVSTGMFVKSSMFTSQIVKGAIEYKHGQILKVNMDVPDEPLAAVKFSSSPYLFMNEESELVEGTKRFVNPEHCTKSALIGYGLCASMRLPVAFREYEAPYYPLSGPAHFGVRVVRGDDKLTTWQFLVELTKQSGKTIGNIEFSTPGAAYERKVNGELTMEQKGNMNTFTLSTQGYERKGSIELNFDKETYSTSLLTKNNFFTTKDVTTKLALFNEKIDSGRQYGIQCLATMDWYIFDHVTKFVTRPNVYMFQTTTTYYPKKVIMGTVVYDTKEKKLSTRVQANQFKQAFEFSGQYSDDGQERGVTVTGKCATTGKAITLYGGYQNTELTKQILFKADVLGYSAKQYIRYDNTNDVHSISQFLSVNGKTMKLDGELSSFSEMKRLKLTADILGRRADTTFLLTNNKKEKSLSVDMNAMQKNANVKTGCYQTSNSKECKINFKIDTKEGEILMKQIMRDGNVVTTLETLFDKYVAGFRNVYSNKNTNAQSLCSSIFYGTEEKEHEPINVCLKYTAASQEQKVVSLTFDMADRNQQGEINMEFTKQIGFVKMNTELIYNKNSLAKSVQSVRYSNDLNNEIKTDVTVGKHNAGLRWFTTKTTKGANVGIEGYVSDKKFQFINKYVKDIVSGTTESKIASELYINDRLVPVTTETIFLNGKGIAGPKLQLNIGKHSVSYSTLITYGKGVYGIDCEFLVAKESSMLFKLFNGVSSSVAPKKMDFQLKLGFGVNGKQYTYGGDISYNNLGNDQKMEHSVKLGLQYSINRRSSIAFILSNDKTKAALNIDFEYIPTKSVSHSIEYIKNDMTLLLSVEFLPKMFYTFKTQLVKNDGYSLTSTTTLKWKNYERTLKMVNSIVNNDKTLQLTTGFGSYHTFTLAFVKGDKKSIMLSASGFKRSFKIIGAFVKPNFQLQLFANGNKVMDVTTSFDRINNNFQFAVTRGKETYLKMMKSYNKFALTSGKETYLKIMKKYNEFKNQHKFQIDGKIWTKIQEWFLMMTKNTNNEVTKLLAPILDLTVKLDRKSDNMELALSNGKKTYLKIVRTYNAAKNQHDLQISGMSQEWVALMAKYNKRNRVVKSSFSAFGKQLVGFTLNMKEKYTISLNIDSSYLKKDIILTGKLDRQQKAIIGNLKYGKTQVELKLRADCNKMILETSFALNDNVAKVAVLREQNSIVFKAQLSPKMIGQIVLEVLNDQILKMSLQRLDGEKMIEETSIQFKLSKDLYNLAFKWNPQTITAFLNMIQNGYYKEIKPAVSKLLLKGQFMSRKAITSFIEILKGAMKDTKAKILGLTNNLETSFDKIDFVAIRGQASQISRKTLENIKDFVKKTLEKLRTKLENIKENIPELLKQYKQIRSKVEKISKDTAEFLPKYYEDLTKLYKLTVEVMERHYNSLNARWNDASKVILSNVQIVSKNITESTKPVFNKAIYLVSNFKLRGKAMKEIVAMIRELVEKYIQVLVKQGKILAANGKIQFENLKLKGIQLYKKGNDLIWKSKLPYVDETIEGVIKIAMEKGMEMKTKITNFDYEKHIQSIKVKIMEKKINGKTIVEHFNTAREDIKKLPVAVKKHYVKLIELINKLLSIINKQSIDITKVLNANLKEWRRFAKPLISYMKLVGQSTRKHFGPILTKAMDKVLPIITGIDLPDFKLVLLEQWKPIETFFLPLIKPVGPLYNNIKTQIKNIKVNGFPIGTFVKFNAEIVKTYIQASLKTAKVKLDEKVKIIKEYADMIRNMTSEEILKQITLKSTEFTKQSKAKLLKIYEERQQRFEALVERLKALYRQFNQQYEKFTSVPIQDHIDDIMLESSKLLKGHLDELSKVIKQIGEIEISKPTWEAWKQADVMVHLNKYGINKRMIDFVKHVKEVNVTRIVAKTTKLIQDMISAIYSKAFVRVARFYGKIEKLHDYIRSIPKKEYEEWVKELKAFSLNNKDKVINFIEKLYKQSQKKSQKLYVQAKFLYKVLYKNTKKNMDKIVLNYVNPAQDLYSDIKYRSQQVYEDLKQPTIDVTNHYQKIVSAFAEENYNIVKGAILKHYKSLDEYRKMMYMTGQEKMEKIKKFIAMKYNEILAEYGDLTYEEILDNAYKFGKSQYKVVRKTVKRGYKKLREQTEKLREQAEKLREQMEKLREQMELKWNELYTLYSTKYSLLVNQIKTDIIPKIKENYQTYIRTIKNFIKKYETEMRNRIIDLKVKGMTIYNNNKDKTIKGIFREVKQYTLKNINRIYVIVKNFGDQKMTLARTVIISYYNKARGMMVDIIIPEVKSEFVSIVNQTLRGSKIMTEEIVKAYTPHAVLAKNFVNKGALLLIERSFVAIKVSETAIKEFIHKAPVMWKNFVKSIEKEEYYKKIVNHELVKEYTSKVQKLMEDLKTKIEQLRNDPMVLKYQKIVNDKVTELKEKAKIVLNDMNGKFEELRNHPIALKYQKIINDKFIELKQKAQLMLNDLKAKMEELRRSPSLLKYQNMVNTKIAELKAKIQMLLKQLKKSLEDLKNHPKTLEYQNMIKQNIADIKTQINIYKQNIENLYQHPFVIKTTETMKRVKRSVLFTANKIKTNAQPKIQEASEMAQKRIEKVQKQIMSAVLFFQNEPEEAFWTGVSTLEINGKALYDQLKQLFNKEMIKKQFDVLTTDAKIQWKIFLNDYFDDWSKETTRKMYEQGVTLIKTMNTKAKDMSMKMKDMSMKMKQLPAIYKKIIMDYYTEKMIQARTFFNKQIVVLKEQWKSCPYRLIVENPVWSEIKDEIMQHEVVTAGRYISNLGNLRFQKLKTILMREYEIKKQLLTQRVSDLKITLEKTVEDLRTKGHKNYQLAKEKAQQILKNINDIVMKVDKFMEEKTISEIVQMTVEKYEMLIAKVQLLRTQVIGLSQWYKEKATVIFNEKRKRAEEIYQEQKAKVLAIYNEKRKRAEEIYQEQKDNVLAVYKRYKAIAMPIYQKYEDKVMHYYNKYSPMAIEKYNILLKKYEQLRTEYENLDLKGKLNKLQKDIIEMYRMKKEAALKLWEQSEIRAKFIALKKMTIRETIESLKQLPQKTKDQIIAAKDQLIAKFEKQLKELKIQYKKYYEVGYAKLMKEYRNLKAQFELKRNQLIELAKPYYTPVLVAYKWIENEVTETVLFIYRYHKLAERYNNGKTFFTSEIERLTPILKSNFKKYNEEMQKYVKEQAKKYSTKAIELTKDLKLKAIKLSKELSKKVVTSLKTYSAIAGDRILRSIHTSMRHIDNVDFGKMRKQISKKAQAFYREFTKYVIIDPVKGEILINIPHGEMVPSFTHQFDQIKSRARRSIQVLKISGKDLMNKINSRIAELKVKIEKVRSNVMEKVMDNTKEIRSDLLSSYNINKRIFERVYIKAQILYKKSLRKAMNQYKTLKTKSKDYIRKYTALAKAYYQEYMTKSKEFIKKSTQLTKLYFQQYMELMKTTYLKYKKIIMDLYNTPAIELYNQLKASPAYLKANKMIIDLYNTPVTELYRKFKTSPAYLKVNKMMMDLYNTRLSEIYRQIKTSSTYLKVHKMVMDLYNTPISQRLEQLKNSPRYLRVKAMIIRLYNTPSKELLSKLQTRSTKLYKMYLNKIKIMINKQIEKSLPLIKARFNAIKKELRPYTETLKTMYKKIKLGYSLKDALYPIYKQMSFATKFYQEEAKKQARKIKAQICKEDPKLCKAIKSSAKVHSFIFKKYATRFNKVANMVLAKYQEGVAKTHRVYRKVTNMIARPKRTYEAVAMVFKDHYVTFDGKSYEFDIPSSKCQYVLVHDFQNADITILKTQDAIKINNKDMKVVIFKNGKTMTVFSDKKIVNGLPVQAGESKCVRQHNEIVCDFAQDKFSVVVDLENDITTISVSAWHQGKLQGLLGTNNRESFDDMKMSNGKLAKNQIQFTNSYEMTGSAKCQLNRLSLKKKECGKVTQKCQKLFANPKSELAAFFKIINTEAFIKACERDLVSCEKSTERKHCSSVNAYLQMIKSRGYQVEQHSECLEKGERMTGEKWQQKQSNKEYDIVVLVSQRKGVNKKPILKVLQKLQSFFKTSSIDSRYALIGFGGKGAYEEAHVRALGKGATVFGTMNDLKRTISNTLIFNGDEDISNDAYHAIVEASLQRFRPGAHKIFVMFNSEPHTSHKYGASIREAIFTLQKESHASLFVFDEINFKSLNKKGMTIGQTNDKIYTTRNLKGLKLSGMELPASEFRDMVQRTNGGMFTNNLINKQNELATVLFDAISDTVTENQRKCLDCEIQTTWFGNSRQLCHPVAC